MLETPRLHRVEQDDIEVPGDPPVLEGVVQHEQLTAEFVDRPARGRYPIGILDVRHVRQRSRQFERLVIRLTGPRAVAAADDANSHAPLAKPPHQPLDHRRLAGAAERQVAHADDRRAHAPDGRAARVVTPVSPANDPGVGRLGQAQQPAQHARGHPSPASADQVAEFAGTQQDWIRSSPSGATAL